MRFFDPLYLLFFIVLIPFVWWRFKSMSLPSLIYSEVASLRMLEDKTATVIHRFRPLFIGLILGLMILALARPQRVHVKHKIVTQHSDIVIVLDTSQRMRAESFGSETRFSVAKDSIRHFIEKRKGDRIGLVVFGGNAYTTCPLTTDTASLLSFLNHSTIGMTGDETTTKNAVDAGLDCLRHGKSLSHMMVLFSSEADDVTLSSLTATGLSQQNLKLYTVNIRAKITIDDSLSDILYKKQHFRADDLPSLYEITDTIDHLEKNLTLTQKHESVTDFFSCFSWFILLFMICDVFLFNTFFMSVP